MYIYCYGLLAPAQMFHISCENYMMEILVRTFSDTYSVFAKCNKSLLRESKLSGKVKLGLNVKHHKI